MGRFPAETLRRFSVCFVFGHGLIFPQRRRDAERLAACSFLCASAPQREMAFVSASQSSCVIAARVAAIGAGGVGRVSDRRWVDFPKRRRGVLRVLLISAICTFRGFDLLMGDLKQKDSTVPGNFSKLFGDKYASRISPILQYTLEITDPEPRVGSSSSG